MRTVIAVALVAFLCAASSPVVAAQLNTGGVVMTTTATTNSVTLNVTVNDTGVLPGCGGYVIMRGPYFGDGGTAIAGFTRQVGVTNTFTVTDTNVQPGVLYWYELLLNQIPYPIPFYAPGCDQYQFRVAHGGSWGLNFSIPAYTGTTPAPLYKGKLIANGGLPGAHLELCESGQIQYLSEYSNLPAGWEPYDGQIVTAYMDWCCYSVQNGWNFYATGFAPATCGPVAVENITWGRVKSMYR